MMAATAEATAPRLERRTPKVGAAWYVVHSHPNQEFFAESGIKEVLGFPTFLPIEVRFVRHARRREPRTYSLFGPYFFVSFERSADEWPSITGIKGVESLLCNGTRPMPIRTDELDAIRTAQKLGFFDDTIGDKLKGRNVRILNQAALDLVAQIKSVGKDRRAEVVLSLFGRENVVRVDLARLRPA